MYSCITEFKNKLFIAYVYLNVRSSKKEFTKPLPYNYIGYAYNTFITINMLFNQDKKDDRKNISQKSGRSESQRSLAGNIRLATLYRVGEF